MDLIDKLKVGAITTGVAAGLSFYALGISDLAYHLRNQDPTQQESIEKQLTTKQQITEIYTHMTNPQQWHEKDLQGYDWSNIQTSAAIGATTTLLWLGLGYKRRVDNNDEQ